MVPNPDVPHDHRARANQTAVANLRRAQPARLTDGDILVNPAPGSNSGIAGDENTVESVGQGGYGGNYRAPAYVAAPLVGHAVEKKGEDVGQDSAPQTVPQAERQYRRRSFPWE